MTTRVPAQDIEKIVGCARDPKKHYGRAVSATQTVYILHSQHCVDTEPDLHCRFDRALDAGIDLSLWGDKEDKTVLLGVLLGELFPLAEVE